MDEVVENGVKYYPMMLIFPDKRRIYYFRSVEEKQKWVTAIQNATGQSNVHDFYVMGQSLGNGRYAQVLRASHKISGMDCAIKVIHKKHLSFTDIVLVRREIDVMKMCNHPNIIRLYDIFENHEFIYIVMELLKGGNFYNYLNDRNFTISERRAKQIAHDLATSIYFLHNFGIAHRDLKPENIMMTDTSDEATIKLVDFGLARPFAPAESCADPLGTLCYVAPEILT